MAEPSVWEKAKMSFRKYLLTAVSLAGLYLLVLIGIAAVSLSIQWGPYGPQGGDAAPSMPQEVQNKIRDTAQFQESVKPIVETAGQILAFPAALISKEISAGKAILASSLIWGFALASLYATVQKIKRFPT